MESRPLPSGVRDVAKYVNRDYKFLLDINNYSRTLLYASKSIIGNTKECCSYLLLHAYMLVCTQGMSVQPYVLNMPNKWLEVNTCLDFMQFARKLANCTRSTTFNYHFGATIDLEIFML